MKFLFCLISFFISFEVFGQDIPNYQDFSNKKNGYVVKLNGDTIKGNIQILETYPATYFIPFKNNEIKFIVSDSTKSNQYFNLNESKYIKYGQDLYRVFTLKEFPYGSFVAKLVDTLRIVNIYHGFEFVINKDISVNVYPNLFPNTKQPSFKIKDVNLIQIGNLPPEIFYNKSYKEYPFIVRDVNFEKFEPVIQEVTIGVNYKRQLKNLFYYKKDVSQYIKSLKDISYNQLPEIVAEINEMYK